ncbi:hypothetical protein [Streptomyces fructofermentans]|uniref:Uncharacterized protein n=1 Tax=Streptomyces fructofermentans TaxID=152141 RepID=A0A918NJ27_9ACTN|nr:hypothetical protein [Streptomyces fructofermentans]GGX77512.1 hypothetical protein GCM10010515_51740 [Streptomyces fructofermentans]
MAHAAPASSTRTPAVSRLAAPVLGAIVYGLWAAAIGRDAGPITGWNVLLGFVTAIAFAVGFQAVRAVSPRLPRELRAFAWAAFAGCAFGFIYSLTDASVVKSAALACLVGASVGGVVFYRSYTHEA